MHCVLSEDHLTSCYPLSPPKWIKWLYHTMTCIWSNDGLEIHLTNCFMLRILALIILGHLARCRVSLCFKLLGLWIFCFDIEILKTSMSTMSPICVLFFVFNSKSLLNSNKLVWLEAKPLFLQAIVLPPYRTLFLNMTAITYEWFLYPLEWVKE